jgi:hypothetical protein
MYILHRCGAAENYVHNQDGVIPRDDPFSLVGLVRDPVIAHTSLSTLKRLPTCSRQARSSRNESFMRTAHHYWLSRRDPHGGTQTREVPRQRRLKRAPNDRRVCARAVTTPTALLLRFLLLCRCHRHSEQCRAGPILPKQTLISTDLHLRPQRTQASDVSSAVRGGLWQLGCRIAAARSTPLPTITRIAF